MTSSTPSSAEIRKVAPQKEDHGAYCLFRGCVAKGGRAERHSRDRHGEGHDAHAEEDVELCPEGRVGLPHVPPQDQFENHRHRDFLPPGVDLLNLATAVAVYAHPMPLKVVPRVSKPLRSAAGD
eukprot:CAMPEP_0172048292 /NCGR_PEP_ID=MMETSP1043-20130122/1453_1 /TAXON_ID=464988 /ORGANISM="Hemiselmis andersenii, Strain CCMP441" /LENGTH=123 /DNA_ID=CAMNT_0012707181 /DNA_START=75 /DNA_END=447 /DNA_ORIENTATION=+